MSKLLGGIFLTIGAAAAIAGVSCFHGTQDLLTNGLRSQGKVVELSKSETNNCYTPVVQFETPDHRIINASCKVGSNPPMHRIADSVMVIYRADSPDDICLDEPLDVWLLTFIFGAFAVVLILVGTGMLIFSPRRA
jgi:hypothetical protein